jgi:glycosyl transferase family 25
MDFEALVISLPEALDRRRRAAVQLAECPVPWQFIDAVRGAALPAPAPEYDARTRMRRFGYPMSGGEIGCFLSHRAAWRRCIARGAPVLILEDDFELVTGIEQVLRTAGRYLPRCDLLRLQGLHPKAARILERSESEQLVWELIDPRGSAAYAVAPPAAARLLQLTNRFWVAVDDFFGRDWEHGLKVFSVWPYPIAATVFASSISGRIKPALPPWARLRRELHRAPDSLRNRARRHWKRWGPVSRLGTVPGKLALAPRQPV